MQSEERVVPRYLDDASSMDDKLGLHILYVICNNNEAMNEFW